MQCYLNRCLMTRHLYQRITIRLVVAAIAIGAVGCLAKATPAIELPCTGSPISLDPAVLASTTATDNRPSSSLATPTYTDEFPRSQLASLEGFQENSLVWSPDGTCLAVGINDVKIQGRILIYEIKSGKLVREFSTSYGVSSVDWSESTLTGQQLIAAGTREGAVLVWDAATGKSVFSAGPEYDKGKVFSVEFSPDGQLLATARLLSTHADTSGAAVSVLSSNTGEIVYTFPDDIEPVVDASTVYDVAWSPDGEVVAALIYEKLVLWHLADPQLTEVLEVGPGESFRVDWSSDGNYLATSSIERGYISLWDMRSENQTTITLAYVIYDIDFAPTSALMAVLTHDSTIGILDVRTRQQIHSLDKMYVGGGSVAWSPDGTMLAGIAYGNVSVWQMSSEGAQP